MTRKDFELIAKAVNRTRGAQDHDHTHRASCPICYTIDITAENLASALAGVNSRFDRPRFLAACGVEAR